MSDSLPDLPPPAAAGDRGFVAGIKAFTVWLGGALAGITAMLYSAGYLVTRAHLNLLGLYGIVDFGNDYFIQEGAKFFLVIGYSYVLSVVLPLLAIGGVAAIVLLALSAMARNTSVVKRSRERLKTSLLRFGPDGRLRLAAFAFLFFVFLIDADDFLTEFQVPLCVANLLYPDPGPSGTTCAAMQEKENAIKAAILNRNHENRAVLQDMFSHLVYATAKTALLAYLVWLVVRPWQRWRLWLVALPTVAACFYGVSLLLDYAVLLRPVVYPRVKVTLEDSPFVLNSPLFLLNKTANDFVIWDSSARRLIWVASGSVKHVEVIGVDDLFAFRPDSRTNPEKNK